ncbi:MAG TPA: hypothetical protein VFG04_14115 [Planctomycetaceae bacterium]|nr:hypothetical protein [Planctomycetaceae bacterium]
MPSIAVNAGSAGVQNFHTGTVTWSSTTSATGASDGSYATGGSFGSGTVGDSLDFWNFNVSIPAGQTVNGLQLDIVARKTQISARAVSFTSCNCKINGILGTPTVNVNGTALTTSAATYTYGGPTDLWGLSGGTLSQSNINSNTENTGPTFGVWFTGGAGASAATPDVDAVTLTVYYSPASTSGPPNPINLYGGKVGGSEMLYTGPTKTITAYGFR